MGEYTRAFKERLVTVYRLAAGNIQMAQQHQKTCYDRHRAGPEYHVGDSVLLFRPRPPLGAAAKFHRPSQGPYIIVYQPFPDTFVLRDPQRPFADVLTVHYNQIKPAPDCGPPPDSPLFLVPSGASLTSDINPRYIGGSGGIMAAKDDEDTHPSPFEPPISDPGASELPVITSHVSSKADTEADLARPPLRPPNPFHLGVLATDAACQLDVLRHDCHALGMNDAQVRVLESADQASLAGFLQSRDG
ncbi:hypothetical protein SprV_0802480900 [Sparganum proliferum]